VAAGSAGSGWADGAGGQRLIVDAHNDLLLELVLRSEDENPFGSRWLPKLRAGGVALQVCPLFATTAPREEARERALGQAREFTRAVEENEMDVFQVRSRGDLERVGGRLGLMLSMEGVEALEGDPAAFDDFYELGVRMVGPTWNYANAFAGGIDEQAIGLTDAGRELVESFAARGVVLDLAHASDQTWRDALELDGRVVVTHAGCRAVRDHPRNLAEWQLEALAERDGVLGIMGLALVVDPDAPTLDRYVDHVDHAVSVMGIEHVGLGADFVDQLAAAEREFGVDENMPPAMVEALRAGGNRFGLESFTGPEHYPLLVETLRARGYDGERLEAILGRNWLRLFETVLSS
jgi:membrane dipeptidase